METTNAAGGYGPPGSGGGWGPPGGGYGAPPAPPGGGYGAPPGGGYGSPGGPPPAGDRGFGYLPSGSPLMPGAGADVNTTAPLLLNIFALVMCGATMISLPLSIAGITFALQAKNARSKGDVLTAKKKAKHSTIAFAATMLLGLAFLAIWQFLTPSGPR